MFNDSAHGARLFGLKEFGNIYSRITNVSSIAYVFHSIEDSQCISAAGFSNIA